MEIVGLKQKVDDDINKLIAKFVGFPSRPTAKIINERIQEYKFDTNLFDYDWDFLKHVTINQLYALDVLFLLSPQDGF